MYFAMSGTPYSFGDRVAVTSRTTYSMRTGSTKTFSASRCRAMSCSVVSTGWTGNALDEEMAAREQSDDAALEQVVLPDDDLLDLEEQTLHLAAGTDARRHRRSFPANQVGCRARPLP